MTKVSKELVKCAKCGKHSEQLVVYSINFMMGNEEENNKLMTHKQKCPYCGYEARNISFEENIEDFIEEKEEKPLLWEEWEHVTLEDTLILDAYVEREESSSYYYIIKGKDNYIVKYRHQKQGEDEQNNYELITHTVDKEKYQEFLMNLKVKVSTWNEKYEKKTKEPIINWYINSQEFPVNYEGINDMPHNFEDVLDDFKEFFQPNLKEEKDDEIFITFKVSDQKNQYTLMLNCFHHTGCLSLLDDNNILLPRVFDKSTVITREEFNELMMELLSIEENWLPIYQGDKNIIWKLDRKINDSVVEVYNGKGATPDNWNDLLDFMAKCERILNRTKE